MFYKVDIYYILYIVIVCILCILNIIYCIFFMKYNNLYFNKIIIKILPPRWYLHLNEGICRVKRFEYSNEPESYAGDNIVTGRVTHAEQVEGKESDQERYR